ncbi:MAG: ATP-dependent Clp protease ATP-binding subunit [Clostridiales bacterium]|nr:ATP-dependent Clp protease ATP-binding subunit [Clostridiales bacterium]
MEMCSRCHKRVAVVYISHIENGKTTNEGICLKCAKEIGITSVGDIMKKMGITDEELDRVDDEMTEMFGQMEDGEDTSLTPGDNDIEEGRAPTIDFQRFFGMPGAGPAGFGPSQPSQQPPRSRDQKKEKDKPKRKYLDQYCQSLNRKAMDGRLDTIVGREKELDRVIQILCRRQKNNPCLIGEPGVGKTAIAEALAQRIVAGKVPYKLRDKEVHLVDLTSIVAGTQFRGQFESRMKGLIEETKALGNIILVIDEVHSIVGAGDAEGSMNAANILKPALSRGEIQVIGATTLNEYRKYIEKDQALERRFQPVIIEEPSVADSVEILKGIKSYYEQFHGVMIPDDTLYRCVTLAERYITDRYLPDKAIDLLDEAASYKSLRTPAVARKYELEAELEKINREQMELETADEADQSKQEEKYKRLAELRVAGIKARGELEALRPELEAAKLTTADLANVIEIWTGVPASNITEHEFARIDKLGDRLKTHLIGQDAAVDAVVRAIKRSRAGVAYKRKPVSFIFAGPTGVGKTELVKQLALDLFDSPETLIRLDMSEFMEKFSVSRIIGAPPGYVGYDEAGQLTEKIRRKPYSVVLFDEIEKAHPDVLNILLQILDDGRITDSQGRTVNFENTVIVMTTNAGSVNMANKAGFGEGGAAKESEDRTMKALSEFLRPEFINRVDEIITFRQLDESDFAKIAAIMFGEIRTTLADKGISFRWTEAAEKAVAKASFSTKFGARNMRRYIQTHVEDQAANIIIDAQGAQIAGIAVDAGEDGVTVRAI